MNFIQINDKLENIIQKYNLQEEIDLITNNTQILSSKQIKARLEELQNDKRLIRIGILGVVKAGKSSLINSLVFKGKSVLPKAITPKTAALSILEYKDTLSAEIIFYSDDEINEMKEEYEQYKIKLEEYKNEELEKLQDDYYDEDEIEFLQTQALSLATSRLANNLTLKASYDNYSKILENINYMPKQENLKIIPNSEEELGLKLQEYTSNDGVYQPFTKEVKIFIPKDELKDIMIVDTPGIDDSVRSREKRTKEYLHKCDVVFVLFRASKFLTSTESNFIKMLKEKNENREIFIIASRIDEIFEDENEFGNIANLDDLNTKIKNRENTYTQRVKKNYQAELEKGFILDNLTDNYSKNPVISTSGLLFSLYSNLLNDIPLDSDEEFQLNRLKNEVLPNCLTTRDETLKALLMISNISRLKEELDKIRTKKEQILQNDEENFIKTCIKDIKCIKSELISKFNNELQTIKNTDLNELNTQRQKLQNLVENTSEMINKNYLDFINSSTQTIKKALKDSLNNYFDVAFNKIESSKTSKEEIITHTHTKEVITGGGGFFRTVGSWLGVCDKYDYDTYTYTTTSTIQIIELDTAVVVNCFNYLIDKLENFINLQIKINIEKNRQELTSNILNTIQTTALEQINAEILYTALKKVINNIKYPNISYKNKIPKYLDKSEKLKDNKVFEYIKQSKEFIYELKNLFNNDITNYINTFSTSFADINLSDEIFSECKNDLNSLEDKIKSKEISLQRLNNILKDLNELGDL